MFSPSDGWHDIPGDPQQHFIFNGYSVCRKYESLPTGSHHDNDPLKHCELCSKNLSILMAIGEKSRKIKMKDLFNLLEHVATKLKTRSLGETTTSKEGVVAVVTSKDGKKTIISDKMV